MRNLRHYINTQNSWRKIFGQELIEYPRDRDMILNLIESDLSPENLTCDGELRGAELQARHRKLITAARQLNELDPGAARVIYELYTGE